MKNREQAAREARTIGMCRQLIAMLRWKIRFHVSLLLVYATFSILTTDQPLKSLYAFAAVLAVIVIAGYQIRLIQRQRLLRLLVDCSGAHATAEIKSE